MSFNSSPSSDLKPGQVHDSSPSLPRPIQSSKTQSRLCLQNIPSMWHASLPAPLRARPAGLSPGGLRAPQLAPCLQWELLSCGVTSNSALLQEGPARRPGPAATALGRFAPHIFVPETHDVLPPEGVSPALTLSLAILLPDPQTGPLVAIKPSFRPTSTWKPPRPPV